MSSNPFLNAGLAAVYIGIVVTVVEFISSLRQNTPDSFIDPLGVLFLLVLSVAVMGFLFFYRPVVLLLDNKREEAVSFFLKTVGTFAGITALVLLAVSLL